VAELDLKNKLPLSERLDQYYEVSTLLLSLKEGAVPTYQMEVQIS
jgi:hypothetical protein